jgi:hypothetical protein
MIIFDIIIDLRTSGYLAEESIKIILIQTILIIFGIIILLIGAIGLLVIGKFSYSIFFLSLCLGNIFLFFSTSKKWKIVGLEILVLGLILVMFSLPDPVGKVVGTIYLLFAIWFSGSMIINLRNQDKVENG